MKKRHLALLSFATLMLGLLVTLWARPAHATWPTTVREDLLVSDTSAMPTALPYSDDRSLIIFRGMYHLRYHILDRYGNLVYPEAQRLTLASNDSFAMDSPPKAIPDGYGGALTSWYVNEPFPDSGLYAQRLDSGGNRLWGDTAIRIFDRAPEPPQYDICSDGEGGLFLAVTYQPAGFNMSDLFLQHVTALGQLPWGTGGRLTFAEPHEQRYPEITSDGNGGIFAVWDDWRSGYPGALYRQHFDVDANPLWSPASGLYTCGHTMFRQVIPDGQSGFILHTDPDGGEVNWVYRFAPTGEQIWSRDHVSWYNSAEMVPGEPGFFYLGFFFEFGVYGQRMDTNGSMYWPSWPSQPGALMKYWLEGYHHGVDDFAYLSPYFYGLLAYESANPPYTPRTQWVQALDTEGQRVFGDSAVLVAFYPEPLQQFYSRNIVPQNDSGAVCIWWNNGYSIFDIYAKRVNADGSLGGPFPLEVTLTPHNPPIQIPPNGGRFIYDLAIADADSVGGEIDAWIVLTLPNGSTSEILSRDNLSIRPDGVLSRSNLVQRVPPAAPPGIYRYTLYAGDHVSNSPWGQDSFAFEKMGAAGMSRVRDSGWTLDGFFESPGQFALTSSENRGPRLIIGPNPFNPTTVLGCQLPYASHVSLQVYDTAGRLVTELVNGWRDAGSHQITFDGSVLPSGIYFAKLTAGDYNQVQKMVLLK